MLGARIATAALLAATAVCVGASSARSAAPDPAVSSKPKAMASAKPAIVPSQAMTPTPVDSPPPVALANPVSATLASQVGSWDCTITIPGVKDDERLVVTWTDYGTNWIRGSTDVPVFGRRPAHRADFAFGYDTAQKMWVSVYTDSLGAYSISKSGAAPTAKKKTFTDGYPIDSHDGPSIVTLGAQRATVDSTWEIAGIAHTSHENCEKL